MELTTSQKKAAAAFGTCAGIASIIAIAVTVSVTRSGEDDTTSGCQGCEVTTSTQPSGSTAFVAITWLVVIIFFILLFVAIAKPNMF